VGHPFAPGPCKRPRPTTASPAGGLLEPRAGAGPLAPGRATACLACHLPGTPWRHACCPACSGRRSALVAGQKPKLAGEMSGACGGDPLPAGEAVWIEPTWPGKPSAIGSAVSPRVPISARQPRVRVRPGFSNLKVASIQSDQRALDRSPGRVATWQSPGRGLQRWCVGCGGGLRA